MALHRLRQEAHKEGAKLASAGVGGLSPSLVLHVLRRDHYKCVHCGSNGQDKAGLSLHHRGGIVASDWLSKMGHKNIPANLEAICTSCHDRLHDRARKDGVDSSQIQPEGDT